jgi:putative transposase
MPRQPRLDIPGLVYHVIARGIERREIFRDDQDREQFLERLGELLGQGGARLYAWCLLSNHFHFLVRRGDQPLSVLMRRLMTGHAVRFNLRYGRSGHLFQNRYKSIVVEEEPYFLQTVRYIHLNPVRAGLISTRQALDSFPFSGHAVLMGCRASAWQDTDAVLERFAANRREAVGRYGEFVVAGWNEGHRHEFTGGGLVRSAGGREALGGRRFEEREAADERILGSGRFVEAVWKEAGEVGRALPGRAWQEVLGEVSEKWELAPEQILGKRRERRVSLARREFLVRAHEEARLSAATLSRICKITHVSVRQALMKGTPQEG